jgi:hypothetical protein
LLGGAAGGGCGLLQCLATFAGNDIARGHFLDGLKVEYEVYRVL